MVCIVVARNGEGDAWVFGSLPEARVHPLPQMDDVYATSPEELAAQYGRSHVDSLLRFAEGRDRSRLVSEFETWRTRPAVSALPSDVAELLWNKVLGKAKKPPESSAEVIRIIAEDRVFREGKVLRSLFGPETRSVNQKAERTREMTDKTRASRIPGNSVITIATEEKKNPKRPGSNSETMFNIYKDGMTVDEAKKAGVSAAALAYDVEKGFITLEAGKEPAAAE